MGISHEFYNLYLNLYLYKNYNLVVDVRAASLVNNEWWYVFNGI